MTLTLATQTASDHPPSTSPSLLPVQQCRPQQQTGPLALITPAQLLKPMWEVQALRR